jgi:hypothetical protein
MGVVERHFLGFYPGAGKKCVQNCSHIHTPATCVWFERWFLFFSTRPSHQLGHDDYYDTGISWLVSQACFDINGCYVGIHTCPELGGCGFSGNLSNLFGYKPPTADEWLAIARKACNRDQYPPNGTIDACPELKHIYGGRHFSFNYTPGR